MTEKGLLDSWKEIAVYLNRSVKTCQRWESEYGLPIHRLDGSSRASVLAYKKEIDEWHNKMLHEKRPHSRKGFRIVPLKIKKNLLAAAVSSVLIILSVVTWQTWRYDKPTTIPFDTFTFTVLYFENNTGREDLNYLRSGLRELLMAGLGQSSHIRVVDSPNLALENSDRHSSQEIKRIIEIRIGR